MEYTIKAAKVFLENEVLENACVYVKDGIIAEINPPAPKGKLIDLKEDFLLPGFVDIHVHGCNGYDAMDMEEEAVNEISKFKLREGVTSFCPTTVTADMDKTALALANINNAMAKGVDGAKILGVFLEGPYIDKEFKGAHPENYIREIDTEEILAFTDQVKQGKTSIIIAPEKEGALDAIEKLVEKGVIVRIGHMAANYEDVIKAIDTGASISVHTYNAMKSIASREPGAIGAIMTDRRIYSEIIVDMIHVHPMSIKALVNARPSGKMIIVTDCMRAGGLEDGEYMLGEMPIKVENAVARTMSGSLAGSTTSINKEVYNMHKKVGVALDEAIHMASLYPAAAMGADKEIGSITVGKKADLIGADSYMNIKFVMVDGDIKK